MESLAAHQDRAHHGANADYEKYVEDIGAQNIADGNLGFVLNGGCQRNYEVGRGGTECHYREADHKV